LGEDEDEHQSQKEAWGVNSKGERIIQGKRDREKKCSVILIMGDDICLGRGEGFKRD